MKPPPFDYHRPQTLEETLDLLAEYGSDAKILAGGQSLIPLMNFRLARPSNLIDINGLDELGKVSSTKDGLILGSLVRHRVIESSPQIQSSLPLLAEATSLIGYPAIRTRGTLGGSITHADPSAELPLAFLVLGGEITLQSKPRGSRSVGAEFFFLTYFTTDVQPDEVATRLVFQRPSPSCGQAILEFSRRPGDFAIVAAAATVSVEENGTVREGRIGVAGVSGTPVRLSTVEGALKGESLTPRLLGQLGLLARESVDPEGDIHASAEFRKHLTGVLARRVVEKAWRQALRNSGNNGSGK